MRGQHSRPAKRDLSRADRRGTVCHAGQLWLDPTQNTSFHKASAEQGGEPKREAAGRRPFNRRSAGSLWRRWRCCSFDQVYPAHRLRYADGRAIATAKPLSAARPRVPELALMI